MCAGMLSQWRVFSEYILNTCETIPCNRNQFLLYGYENCVYDWRCRQFCCKLYRVGLGWVHIFRFATRHSVDGFGLVGSPKMDPRSTLPSHASFTYISLYRHMWPVGARRQGQAGALRQKKNVKARSVTTVWFAQIE